MKSLITAAPTSILATTLAIALTSASQAQTRSVRDTATAYGARLTAKGQPAGLNESRVNNRIENRIDNRLSLRVERYRPDAVINPTAAFQPARDDKTRNIPVIVPQTPGDDPQ